MEQINENDSFTYTDYCYRGWQAFGSFIPHWIGRAYWVVFWIIALSFLIARLVAGRIPEPAADLFELTGAYWMAAMEYFLIILLAIDLVRLLDRLFHFIPRSARANPSAALAAGVFTLLLVAVLIVCGRWTALNPRITNYDVAIAKNAGAFKEIRIAMVSDIHLGEIVNSKNLEKMVGMIEQLEPDLIIFGGDIIDGDARPYLEQNMPEILRRLRAPLGVFGVLGNHEYFGGISGSAEDCLKQGGITILRDNYVKIADSFYIAGREDKSSTMAEGIQRKDLASVLKGVDASLPLILLDHQPTDLSEAQSQGADLQLSGHTHRGQYFPNQLITDRIFEVNWGYLRKGNLNVIVSSGFGTWGPPIRLWNYPELVQITLRFTDRKYL